MMDKCEYELIASAMKTALRLGASAARMTLCKSTENLVSVLDGEVDKVTCCSDRSLSVVLMADGRYGSFSTNKLDYSTLEDFLGKAVETVRMMAPDSCRTLPDPERCCKTALTGDELDLYDSEYESLTPSRRTDLALSASLGPVAGNPAARRGGAFLPEGVEVISEEGEYSDSLYETLIMDSNGLECRHRETSFDYGVEVTVEADGGKYSAYSWDSSTRLSSLKPDECGRKASLKAASMAGSDAVSGGKYNMVIDSEVASKVVSPLLNALNAYSLHQQNSFLAGSLGKRLFPEGMTLVDNPHIKGECCSKLFDSEGVATQSSVIIDKGVVKEYFVNTYMSRKLDLSPTVEDPTRPELLPWPSPGLDRSALMKKCGRGILVMDFNGGNSNQATGDFSYGVEGFLFENGEIVRPVDGMLVTGNFLSLWSSLVAIGDDARRCMSKLIPTLAFSNVDFSG